MNVSGPSGSSLDASPPRQWRAESGPILLLLIKVNNSVLTGHAIGQAREGAEGRPQGSAEGAGRAGRAGEWRGKRGRGGAAGE